MNIALVGSRTFPDLALVGRFCAKLDNSHTIISGGASGVDTKARESCTFFGVAFIEHLPDTRGCTTKHDHTLAYYRRNQRIVDDADILVAFTEKDTGGTWDSIRRARKKGIPVHIVRPFSQNLPII